MPRLMITKGEGKGRIFEFNAEVTIGRSPSNKIRLTDTQVSRVHARLVPFGDAWMIRDCQSRNGFFINGKPAREAQLKSGDEIQICSTVLAFDPAFAIRSVDDEGGSVILMEDQAPEGNVTAAIDASVPSLPPAATDPESLARSNELLRRIYEIGLAIATIQEPKALVGRILDLLKATLDADRGFIMLREEGAHDLSPAAVRVPGGEEPEIAISKTILQRVVKHRKSILSADAMEDPRFESSDSIRLSQVRSVMCVPLIVRDRVIGALYMDKVKPYESFADEDLRFLTAVSRLAAATIESARTLAVTRDENLELRRRLSEGGRIVGSGALIRRVLDACDKVAPTDSTVLILGETGTGKELVARYVHENSHRLKGRFVAVNCAAVPENLLESELFGFERGAFTGAHKRKKGKFEEADGGTLFLDEIGEIPLAIQGKILRALEEKKFERLGGNEVIKVDVRIIAATNRDLSAATAEGRFREDLYYRLAVVPVTVPPLRDRAEDLRELLEYFLDSFSRSIGKTVRSFTPEAMKALSAYGWPGNIRELKNLVERVVVLADSDVAGIESLPAQMVSGTGRQRIAALLGDNLSLPDVVREAERHCIEKALEKTGGKKIEAARILGISRPTLDKKLRSFGMF